MTEKFKFWIIILIILSFINCEDEIDEQMYERYSGTEDVEEFEANLKKFLIKKNLFNSSRIIERKEMRRIFFEIVVGEDYEGIPTYYKGYIKHLIDYFMDVYYQDNEVIRGSDIFDLIDITQIVRKFDQISGSLEYLLDDEEEELEGEEYKEEQIENDNKKKDNVNSDL